MHQVGYVLKEHAYHDVGYQTLSRDLVTVLDLGVSVLQSMQTANSVIGLQEGTASIKGLFGPSKKRNEKCYASEEAYGFIQVPYEMLGEKLPCESDEKLRSSTCSADYQL